MNGDFYGLPTRIIASKFLRLEFLAKAGPRIVRLMPAGTDENQLAETPDLHWTTPYGEYYLRGGHRLWHAPEGFPRSWCPDNDGLVIKEHDGIIRLVAPPEPDGHIRKSLEIQLNDDRPAVTLRHELWNGGAWPVEIAPWTITQLPLGGTAVLPQPVEAMARDGAPPNSHLVLWPYTRWQDPRLLFRNEHILIEAQPHASALKVGHTNRHGWIAYFRQGILFVKRFEPRADQPHTDMGCNAEVYCNERYIELEVLAPLGRLEPGQSVSHVESLELYAEPDQLKTVDDVKAFLNE
jgi:hypothetical protein